jgi:hypothetical protein
MDINTLVQGISAILVPALPYLTEFGGKMAESAAEKIGEDLWEGGMKIWGKLKGLFESHPAALEAAKDVVAAPDDGDAQAALRQQLKKIISGDRSLAAELEQLLGQLRQQNVTVIASGERSVAGQSFNNSVIITGDGHTYKSE